MIDIEVLAAPAFLVEISPQGTLVDLRLNTAGRAHPDLLRDLARDLETGGRAALWREVPLAAPSRDRVASDIALFAPSRDGAGAWRASIVPVTAPGGRVEALLGLCREVPAADRVRAADGDRLSIALQAIHGAEWRYDVRGGTYRGSDEIATLLGESAPRPVAWAEWLERVHPQDRACFLGHPAPEGTVEFRFHAAAGEPRWARCSRVALRGDAGEVEAVLGIMVDVTAERARETALAELATHDPLTGLLNRRGLRQELGRLRAERPPSARLALLAVDLDRFKATNDRHGHAAGDAVLVEAARRLAAESEVCARLGGDEFVAVLPVEDEAEAHRLRDRVARSFRLPLAFRGRWLTMSASVGASCLPAAADVGRMIDEADADLYARKRARADTLSAAA